jgi:hypothetical protein
MTALTPESVAVRLYEAWVAEHERLCEHPAVSTWTCFHCGESFTNRSCAAAHFGDDEDAEPACKIKGGAEHHLIAHIRDLEAQLRPYRDGADHITAAWDAKSADHASALRQAEEDGYNKGVREMVAEPAITERIAAAEKAARVKALEELREILQPFAAEADMWGDSVPDDYAPLCVEMGHTDGRYYGSPAKYTLAHLRKIRALITAAEAQPVVEKSNGI